MHIEGLERKVKFWGLQATRCWMACDVAPPFDFLERVLLPILGRMGPRIVVELDRPGFYPAGGGRFRVAIEPARRLGRLDLLERGEIVRRRARASVSNLSRGIAERELEVVRGALSWSLERPVAEEIRNATGPGNITTVELEFQGIRELVTGFGRSEAPAARVAMDVVGEVREYLASGAPVGPHLADQLLVPMAIAGEGSLKTVRPDATHVDERRDHPDVPRRQNRSTQGRRIAVDDRIRTSGEGTARQ